MCFHTHKKKKPKPFHTRFDSDSLKFLPVWTGLSLRLSALLDQGTARRVESISHVILITQQKGL